MKSVQRLLRFRWRLAAEKRRKSGVRGVAGLVDKITATLPPYDMNSDYGLKIRVAPTIMGFIGVAISDSRNEKDNHALEAFEAVAEKNFGMPS